MGSKSKATELLKPEPNFKPCATCKHYKAKKCDFFSYIAVNPVTGKKKLYNRVSAEEQRQYGFLRAFINAKCGIKGRYWCLTE